MISPRQYCDPNHHNAEVAGLFSNVWLFIGLRLELEGLSHQGIRVGDTNVLLQCDAQGQPRAYLNVCSHRHAQLCEVGKHTGAVRCPYHGWVYDREGVPVGIPQKQAFLQVVADPRSFRLTEFACEAAGQFIFVRLSSTGPSLTDYLGNQFDFLVRASQGMISVKDEFRKDVAANWKVMIENSLEGYHVPNVHSKTFMQIDGMGREETAPQFYLQDPLHSHLEHEADADWVKRFYRMGAKIGQWPWRFEHYTHHFVFPNLTVTSFMGYSFHVQRFEPTSGGLTTVHSRTVGVEFSHATPAGARMMEHIYADGHAFTSKVFDEDAGICRKVQAGLENATRLAVLAKGLEDRVRHFQNAYQTYMNMGNSEHTN
jgi:phenylpropionate dioxygenase-like ring-hydroxylating dioxygenase large terminal subunit